MVRQSREVVTSLNYEKHLTEILEYGIQVFGYSQSRKYFNAISRLVENLDTECFYHPECRYLATKNQTYRNIILDAHLLIYRITSKRIEVLDILHSASSIRKIRSIRNIRL
jgi:plasmid stabilization system protein ParE